MNPDPASLDNLRDIATLPPVSWWPLAPGWWFVIAIVAIVACVAAIKAWKRWQANAYRRAAKQELNAASSAAEIADILKRAAMCAYPRTDVASLTGARWCEWLPETGGANVPRDVELSLSTGVLANREEADTARLKAFAENWVTSHRSLQDASDTSGTSC